MMLFKENEKWEIINNDNIKFIRPVTSLDGLSEIELESGRRFKARLIVGNDGKKSFVRNVHDIECSVHAYNQKWIVKTLIHDRPLSGAFQRFLATGPIAVLPLWKNYSFLSWSCPNQLADELMELDHEDFIKEVNSQFFNESKYKFGALFDRYLPSGIKEISFDLPPSALHNRESKKLKGFSFPLESCSANQHAKNRVVIIGDAATSLHPITGQGYNLGMTASAHLANAIISQLKAGGDIGSYEYWLKEFAEKTKRNEIQVQTIQEIFKKGYLDTVFGSETLGRLMSYARNAVVDAIESVPILKYEFAFFGAGLTLHPVEYEWNKEF